MSKSVVTAQKTDKIEYWPIERLKPYQRNPRKNDAVVDRMVASIQEFGFKIPVLARSDGTVVDGHLRLKAATKLNVAEIPVILCDEWTDAQVKAFRLLVNRSVSWADWDEDLLRLEILDLKALEFNLDLTGFDEKEVVGFLSPGTAGLTDEDAVPEPPKEPITKPGDLWLLGKHRLLCGDSTKADDVVKLLARAKPNLMVTDPPYGVDYDPDWRNRADRANGKPYGASAIGQVANDDRIDWAEAYKLFPGSVAYVWHAGRHASEVQRSLEAADFEIRCQIIWGKQQFVISRGHYHWQHEPCWYAFRKGKASSWVGDRSQTTLWRIDKPVKSETGHSTQKPVECMRRPMLNHTNPGQSVYDPFMGSGTTIIAAESTGRVCYGIEIDPIYVDVAVQRWQDFTGKQAKLERHAK